MIEPEKDPLGLFYTTIVIFAVALIGVSCLNSIYKKNTEKLPQNKPIDRQTISTNNITGNVESIHPWGRTEVVPMKSIELEYFEYCDEWVMYGEVVQPTGRKGYFMPVLRGRLNCKATKHLTQTWIEHEIIDTMSNEKPETFEDFRVANIRAEEGKIIDINYSHYRLSSDHSWNMIASWKANVNPDVPDPVPENVQTNDVPLIVCSSCKGTGEKLTDVNKLMMDASLAIFFNHHLMVDKCEKCVKLPYGDGYDHCDVVNDHYQILVKEYAAAGPKMDMAACEQCMGMGTFSSKDLTTGTWLTQEEYDEKN